jgi:hypothetical protein
LSYNWIWLAQIQGSSLIELRPKYPCEKICSIIKSIKLRNGDLSIPSIFIAGIKSFVLVMYSHLYEAFYRPLNRETILLAQGVD